MKKVCVNKDTCIGCGACVSITNEKCFKFDDDGYSTVVNEIVAKEDEELVEEAASACPVDAIEVTEVEESKK